MIAIVVVVTVASMERCTDDDDIARKREGIRCRCETQQGHGGQETHEEGRRVLFL